MEEEAMQIEQKRFAVKHTFTFSEQQLNFAFKDRSGSGDVDVAYADIPKKKSVRIDENSWLRNAGILWCAIGVAALLLKWSGVMWLPIGIACLVWYHFSKVRYTILQAEEGSIWVIQDKKHDDILREISDRRNRQLLSWYGEINYENDPQSEIKKFNWLAEQEVLSKEQADMKIAEVKMKARMQSTESTGNLLN
jgi:hypothetical protein